MKMTGAIFDMDGTLIDSMYIWDIVGSRYLESKGITPPDDLRSKLRALSLDQAAVYLKKAYDLPETPQEIMNGINDIVRKEYKTRIALKDGTKEFLQKLSDKGIPMVIATATDRNISEQVLNRLGIRHYFSEIFSCPDWNTGKDEPLIFDMARDFLGTEKESTVIFEDALHAITTAVKSGYPVIGVYDRSEAVNEKEIVHLCDAYYLSLKECEL